jgi:hypothetical protein
MRTRSFFAALGLAGALALSAAPAQAGASVSIGFNTGHGHHHPHGHVHYHGGHRCAVRHDRYYYEPGYYGPAVRYRPYAPPPPPWYGDDCRWYRGRWHCY